MAEAEDFHAESQVWADVITDKLGTDAAAQFLEVLQDLFESKDRLSEDLEVEDWDESAIMDTLHDTQSAYSDSQTCKTLFKILKAVVAGKYDIKQAQEDMKKDESVQSKEEDDDDKEDEKEMDLGDIGDMFSMQRQKSLELAAKIHDIDVIDDGTEIHLFELDDAKIDQDERSIGIIPSGEYVVNYDHVQAEIAETHDCIEIDETSHKATKLLEIFDKIAITDTELSLWAGYGGGKLFSSKSNARSMLSTVLDYAESNSQCSKHIKTKAHIITKLILEKGEAAYAQYTHILLLLASHGNVCNVMKETAISDAYGIMTNKLDELILAQTLEQQIAKILRDFRILLVEELFHSFKFTNNTHYIAGFHNTMAKEIGVIPYNDPNICYPGGGNWKKGLSQRFLKMLYTKERILEQVVKQINEQKIGYQKIVKYFEDNCPPKVKSNQFLHQAIDIDTGKIKENYLCWLLRKMDILSEKTENWTEIEKCWDDI